jgi:hypothetical protein
MNKMSFVFKDKNHNCGYQHLCGIFYLLTFDFANNYIDLKPRQFPLSLGRKQNFY